MMEKRLKEAERLGFKKCIIPENNKKLLKESYKLDIIGVKNINEAMKQAVRDSKANELPTVFHRKNGEKWLVTVRLEDWVKLHKGELTK